jgi:hypothetical protein
LIDSASGCFLKVYLCHFSWHFGFSDGRSRTNEAFLNNKMSKGIIGVKYLSFATNSPVIV